MLVLTRKVGEEIVIDGRIRVRVIASHGNRVRIGIDAPEEVSVVREELLAAGEPVKSTTCPQGTRAAPRVRVCEYAT